MRRKLKRLGDRYPKRSAEHRFTEAGRPFLARFKEMLG